MCLLSATEISKLLGKSRQWIWVLIRTGQLKAKKVGRQFVIDSEDLKQFDETKNYQNKKKV
jgi:excisionase family DNA binding protein